MPDRLDPWAGLAEQGHAVLRRARSAAQVTGVPGSDPTGSVHVTLDADGRVAGVTVAPGRRRKIDAEKLAEAVVDAVRDAAGKRLHAWGHAYSDDTRSQPSSSEVDTDADRAQRDRDELQRRLQQMATAPMSGEDRRAALSELLALAEAIERGIDEVFSIQRVSRPRWLRCSEYSPTTGRGLRLGETISVPESALPSHNVGVRVPMHSQVPRTRMSRKPAFPHGGYRPLQISDAKFRNWPAWARISRC